MPTNNASLGAVVSDADLLKGVDTKWCQRMSVTGVPLIDDGELVRHFPNIPDGRESATLDLLNRIIDPKNAAANAPKGYVIDPEADKTVFPGVYRLVSNVLNKQAMGYNGIIQTLRRGFFNAIVWTAARVVKSNASVFATQSNATERFLYVEFPYIDPNATRSLVDHLLATKDYTANTVTIGTQKYPEAFHTADVATRKEQDGTDTIILTLAKQLDATATGAGGASPSDSHKEEYFETDDTIDRTGQAAPLADVDFVAGSVSQVDNKRDAQTGLWRTIIRTLTAVARAASGRETEYNGHMTRSMVEDENTVAEPATPSAVGAGNTIVTQLKRLNIFGRWKVNTTTLTPVAYCTGTKQPTDGTWAATDGWLSYTDQDGTSYYCEFGNLTTAQVDILKAACDATTRNSFTSRRNEFGLYDGTGRRDSIAGKVGGAAGAISEQTWTSYEWQFKGEGYTRKLTYTCGFISSASFATVKAAITTEGNTQGPIFNNGAWEGRYRTLTTIGAWTTTDTTVP